MTKPRASLYHRHRFPAEIIAEAVWLYYRFPLSFRMVEDMLAYRGIIVTHKTVHKWAEKFGREYANTIRRRTPRLGDKCIWMRWSSRSKVSSTFCGARLIRMALYSRFWCRSAAIPRLPSVSRVNFNVARAVQLASSSAIS